MSDIKPCQIVYGNELDGSDTYQVLIVPDEGNFWLTEPEDRNFYRDLKPLVEYIERLRSRIAELEAKPQP